MAFRKTVDIVDLIQKINDKNSFSVCTAAERMAWNNFLETILYDADVYIGFGYLPIALVPNGHLPGIAYDKDGKAIFPDESRRVYYTSPKLTSKQGK